MRILDYNCQQEGHMLLIYFKKQQFASILMKIQKTDAHKLAFKQILPSTSSHDDCGLVHLTN